jgi:phosphate starvation-inducible protein PhoH
MAAQLLNAGKIEKIFITRPYAHLGKDYGATPGTDAEKLEMFMRPMLDVLKKTLGEGKYQYCIDTKKIETAPLEKIQGRSFDESCAIICDESQCATKPQLLSLVTRLGDGVNFLAILGDPRQSIHKGENALDWITSFFERNNISNVGVVHFTEQDCVRSGIVKDILIAFEKEGGFYNQMKD